ncbi:LysR family transcriptional regulator [Jannaschia sp. CCS1]|uniref:LysR family transcriptional regulator n=1 Tax=Jannaschia sp. (strain CCS1) TaxID=290400 RepID=UPI000053A43D|nr:LysR family transcriptional regulator [Jannaschia sp. CCS1]ABD53804.1 transcriptional regulator, LysR family [Jannaschia sp. CCS1]
MIDLRLIETFIQAARRESFSSAAKALHVSPGAVSQNIKSLEEQLQTRLFTRTTRQIKLTPEGQRFLQRCAPAVEALQTAASAIQDEREAFQGRLRITSTTAFGRAEILPLIASFQETHPELEIELSLSDGFVDLVAEEYDLAIRGGILPDSDYIARLLIPVTPLVCAAPGYLKKFGIPKNEADLASHRLIGMRSNPSQRVFAWEFSDPDSPQPRRVEVTPTSVMNDPESTVRAASLGMGLAQVGSNVVLPLVASGELRIVFPEAAVQSRGLYAVYPSKRFAPKKLTAFLDHLVDGFSQRADLIYTH